MQTASSVAVLPLLLAVALACAPAPVPPHHIEDKSAAPKAAAAGRRYLVLALPGEDVPMLDAGEAMGFAPHETGFATADATQTTPVFAVPENVRQCVGQKTIRCSVARLAHFAHLEPGVVTEEHIGNVRRQYTSAFATTSRAVKSLAIRAGNTVLTQNRNEEVRKLKVQWGRFADVHRAGRLVRESKDERLRLEMNALLLKEKPSAVEVFAVYLMRLEELEEFGQSIRNIDVDAALSSIGDLLMIAGFLLPFEELALQALGRVAAPLFRPALSMGTNLIRLGRTTVDGVTNVYVSTKKFYERASRRGGIPIGRGRTLSIQSLSPGELMTLNVGLPRMPFKLVIKADVPKPLVRKDFQQFWENADLSDLPNLLEAARRNGSYVGRGDTGWVMRVNEGQVIKFSGASDTAGQWVGSQVLEVQRDALRFLADGEVFLRGSWRPLKGKVALPIGPIEKFYMNSGFPVAHMSMDFAPGIGGKQLLDQFAANGFAHDLRGLLAQTYFNQIRASLRGARFHDDIFMQNATFELPPAIVSRLEQIVSQFAKKAEDELVLAIPKERVQMWLQHTVLYRGNMDDLEEIATRLYKEQHWDPAATIPESDRIFLSGLISERSAFSPGRLVRDYLKKLEPVVPDNQLPRIVPDDIVDAIYEGTHLVDPAVL